MAPIFSRFGANFFTVYADFSRLIRDINGEKKHLLLMIFFTVSFSRFAPSRNFVTWHKTQVSAIFPRTFPRIETASSWDFKSCVQLARTKGGGLETARGTLGQPKEFIGRLGIFVMSLWQCWLIQFDLLNPKPQPLHDQYADAKYLYDHAKSKMAFQFARAATCNVSQHGHRNLDKEGTTINAARMRCGDCHENKVSRKFQKLFDFAWIFFS